MKKKAIVVLICAAISLAAAGCGQKAAPEGGQAVTMAQAAGDAAQEQAEVQGLTEAIAEEPVLLTSAGQSADYEMVKTMLDKNDIKCEKNSLATSADLDGVKTLMLAVGGSSKGLGAAGIDANGELERVTELVDAAKEKGIIVIAVHVGGEARRGELSDKFIAPSLEKADYAIVVADGDKDGLMKGIAAKAGIPFDEVSSMADVVPKLGAAFK